MTRFLSSSPSPFPLSYISVLSPSLVPPPFTLFYKAYYTTMNDSVSDTDVGYDAMGSTGAQRKRNGPNLGTSIQSDFTVQASFPHSLLPYATAPFCSLSLLHVYQGIAGAITL